MKDKVKEILKTLGVAEENLDKGVTMIVKAVESFAESVEDRKLNFKKELASNKADYSVEMLKKFWDYWTEISPNGKRLRFEKEKAFDMKKRLKTWQARSKAYTIVGMLNAKKEYGK